MYDEEHYEESNAAKNKTGTNVSLECLCHFLNKDVSITIFRFNESSNRKVRIFLLEINVTIEPFKS